MILNMDVICQGKCDRILGMLKISCYNKWDIYAFTSQKHGGNQRRMEDKDMDQPAIKVKLDDITDAMEMLDQYSEAFLNERTGEIEWVNEMVMSTKEQEEIYDRLDEDGYFRLPSQYDINEYGIMEDFVYSLPA